jgi:Protein of unknown function (DUF3037)
MAISKFWVISYQPNVLRTEHLHIGVVAQKGEDYVVKLASNLKKLRAFDARVSMKAIRDQETSLGTLIKDIGGVDAAQRIGLLGSWQFTDETGQFQYHNESDASFYEGMQWALKTTCEPVSARPEIDRAPKSRLFLDLKESFKVSGLLGQKLSDHKLVSRYTLKADEDLHADFALQNSVMHYIETVDFRSVSNLSAKRTEAQSKALVLSIANSEDPTAISYAVIAGSQNEQAKASVKLLERFANQLYVYESSSDMTAFIDKMHLATGVPKLVFPTDVNEGLLRA